MESEITSIAITLPPAERKPYDYNLSACLVTGKIIAKVLQLEIIGTTRAFVLHVQSI